MSGKGWIGVDLDGTLAYYDEWRGVDHIGAPIPFMVDRVKGWLAKGKEVRILTARVYCDPHEWDWDGPRGRSTESYHAEKIIKAWCLEHLGVELLVTCMKDYGMIELWDDRCVQILCNTGRSLLEDALMEKG